MKQSFSFLLFFLTLPLFIMISGCQTTYPTKSVTVIQQFDNSLSLSRDKQSQQLYFQSKNSEPKGKCGNDWYSDSASLFINDTEQKHVNLNQLIDITSLKLDKIISNEYYLSDNNHRYTVILTMCDNQVSYANSLRTNSPRKIS